MTEKIRTPKKKVCNHKWVTNWRGGQRELSMEYDPSYFNCENCGIDKVMPLIDSKNKWAFNKGYNQALSELSAYYKSQEPKRLGVEEVKVIVLRLLEANPMTNILDELPNFMSNILPNKIAEAIYKAQEGGK